MGVRLLRGIHAVAKPMLSPSDPSGQFRISRGFQATTGYEQQIAMRRDMYSRIFRTRKRTNHGC